MKRQIKTNNGYIIEVHKLEAQYSGVKYHRRLYVLVNCIQCNVLRWAIRARVKSGISLKCNSCAMRSVVAKKADTPEKIIAILTNSMRKRTINNAKSRNIEFALSDEFISKIIFNDCCYCSAKPNQTIRNTQINTKFNGIDRVNNELGYIEVNCVACCKICNAAKSTLSLSTFLKWVNNIAIYQGYIKNAKEQEETLNG